MTKVISFINRKGGTGKTTNAVNVATALKRMGFAEVTLLETDDNYSLAIIRASEMEAAASMPHIIQTQDNKIENIIRSLRKNLTDIVIVDGAANMDAAIIAVIARNSDIVIIPTSLSGPEILVTKRTIADIAPALDQNPSLQVALLPTRIHWLTSQDTVEREMAALETPVMDYVPNFKEYTHLSTLKPAKYYKRVADQILKMLENKNTWRPTIGITASVEVMKLQKNCVWCGDPFFAKSDKAEFCKSACKQAHYRHGQLQKSLPAAVTTK